MSYGIRLCDPVTHETLEVDSPHLMAGGTYALGGTTELWLNVTYNYARHYHCLGERGIREIYGKTGAESIPMLKAAALRLGDDVSDDYWGGHRGQRQAGAVTAARHGEDAPRRRMGRRLRGT